MLLFALLLYAPFLFAQSGDSTKSIGHFSGAASVTNNGISVIPTFSLGKPAAIFNLELGKDKLSFEPELRFSLEGKPWTFVFWWRYKLLNANKWKVRVGAHPALNFKAMPIPANGDFKEVLVSRRFLAGEVAPTYWLSRNRGLGMYYLYSRGLDLDVTRNLHFLTINSTFSNIGLPGRFLLRLTPQLYYLKMDDRDGFYANVALTLSRKDFPVSFATIFNQAIQTNIAASKRLVWNATLTYSFHKNYVEQ